MRLKIRSFVEANLEYYKAMAKAFPDEPIWKKATQDTQKLLMEEKTHEPKRKER